MRILVGGVGYRWQRDASFGVVAIDELVSMNWPPEVDVRDLGYGAIYAAQDIADGGYDRVILLAAATRGRERGALFRYRWTGHRDEPDELQEKIREAGAGIVGIDHLLAIAAHFGALPRDVTVIELEPFDQRYGIELSPVAQQRLRETIASARQAVLEPRAEPLHA
jgi:hydrogenase maturation protease